MASKSRFVQIFQSILTMPGGRLRFFSASDLTLLALSNAHCDTILHCQALRTTHGFPDGKQRKVRHKDLLVVGCQDRTISLWSCDRLCERPAGGSVVRRITSVPPTPAALQ
jgi:hypothetical protein